MVLSGNVQHGQVLLFWQFRVVFEHGLGGGSRHQVGGYVHAVGRAKFQGPMTPPLRKYTTT